MIAHLAVRSTRLGRRLMTTLSEAVGGAEVRQLVMFVKRDRVIDREHWQKHNNVSGGVALDGRRRVGAGRGTPFVARSTYRVRRR